VATVITQEAEPAEVGLDAARLTGLDNHFRRYVDDGRLPGWAFAVSRHGRVAHVQTYGRRDLEADAPVELDTVFRIYSMTKPITSVAAMMLYERGLLELTDPVARYLPEFAQPRVYRGGSDLKQVTTPAAQTMRVWHLLTHTAGLTYGFHRVHPVDARMRALGYEWSAPPQRDLAAAVRDWAALPLLFEPGAEWNYSVATDVLGRLVEVVAGRSLDEFLRAEILEPLGMVDTGFSAAASADRLAALYVPDPASGGLRRNDALGDAVLAPTWFSGGGGLVSTLTDYHRFTQFLRNRGALDGVRLLGRKTFAFMVANHLPGGADLAAFGRPLYAETPFDGIGFGLGFSVVLDPVKTRFLTSVGEFGWGGAASTVFWVDPVEDLTAVFLTQLLPSSTYPIRPQLRQLIYSSLID
jgi:CubicO group peptidase (beta-lactamase class C family)